MNYWPAEVTNLPEMHDPLFSMVKDLSETGKESAKEMYGARGWAVHHNTDVWRMTGPIDGAFYGMWPMGGAWLSQHLWQHYLYSGDQGFLSEYYPILKGAATYFVDVLQEEPTHGWVGGYPIHVTREPSSGRRFIGTGQHHGQPIGVRCIFECDKCLRNIGFGHGFCRYGEEHA